MDNIQEYKDKVNKTLKEFLEKKLKEDGRYSKSIRQLIENITEFNLRSAKRIRPLISIFTYKCFKDDERIIKPSICIELMQAYLLIHDDIIDKADLRRGKSSMHKIYEKQKDEDFGISMAILAGNLCASYMYETIIESDFNDTEKLNALKYISWTADRENYGQALDIIPNFKDIKEKDIWQIYELKTATYTIQGPIYIAGALANAPKEKIDKLQIYAYNIGTAFQIQDDINGIFGEIKDMGKPIDSDIKEGKKTLIIVKTLEFCNKQDKEFIMKNYGNKNINEEDIEKIKEIIKKCGAYDYSKQKLNEKIQEGKKSIQNLEVREEGKKFLLDIADYVNSLA
jgi:geranylgeranyl diphosphate synthase, type I